MTRRIGFRHCDTRLAFLWQTAEQPAARWHGPADGPANYFADTPTGAWAEFLRHEEITDAADLSGVRRSLWAVELPGAPLPTPRLSARVLRGGLSTYPRCQAEARRLRDRGAVGLEAPSAALADGGARGQQVMNGQLHPAPRPRNGRVWVFFGELRVTGWLAVDGGAPPASVLAWVRPLHDA